MKILVGFPREFENSHLLSLSLSLSHTHTHTHSPFASHVTPMVTVTTKPRQ